MHLDQNFPQSLKDGASHICVLDSVSGQRNQRVTEIKQLLWLAGIAS
ncbi:MAG: hypothetical protein ACI9DH_000463 [Halioglobus sp.]|jgi:hypothetical protein